MEGAAIGTGSVPVAPTLSDENRTSANGSAAANGKSEFPERIRGDCGSETGAASRVAPAGKSGGLRAIRSPNGGTNALLESSSAPGKSIAGTPAGEPPSSATANPASWLCAVAGAAEPDADDVQAVDTAPIAPPPTFCPSFTSQVSTSPVVVLR